MKKSYAPYLPASALNLPHNGQVRHFYMAGNLMYNEECAYNKNHSMRNITNYCYIDSFKNFSDKLRREFIFKPIEV